MENKVSGHVFKIRNSSDQKLFPELPAFDLLVRREVLGWIWTDEVYTWSYLSGYIREFMGSVSTSDHTGIGGRVEEFYLCSRQLEVSDDAIPPCYGILHGILKDFPISSTDFMRNSLRGSRSQTIIIQ